MRSTDSVLFLSGAASTTKKTHLHYRAMKRRKGVALFRSTLVLRLASMNLRHAFALALVGWLV